MWNYDNIIRVFPRKTSASPEDTNAYFGPPDIFVLNKEIKEVHISTVFTWDIPKAEKLAEQWKSIAPVKLGGPAFNEPGFEFTSGLYLKPGCVITSRGCPNHCWFCSVWKRESGLKELPIVDGYNIFDDNLLACSNNHIIEVFNMLRRQKERAIFTGGIEAARLKPWHVDLFLSIRVNQIFFAYDTPDDYEPLVEAAKMMNKAGFERHKLRCYVLIGYKGDTLEQAEERLKQVVKLGMFPMAMLMRDTNGKFDRNQWGAFRRYWVQTALIHKMVKDDNYKLYRNPRRTDKSTRVLHSIFDG